MASRDSEGDNRVQHWQGRTKVEVGGDVFQDQGCQWNVFEHIHSFELGGSESYVVLMEINFMDNGENIFVL
jgi:hypothetical protein